LVALASDGSRIVHQARRISPREGQGGAVNNCYVLTGAPGSGKTAILRELVALGFAAVAEPARQVLAQQRAIDGTGVPERDPRRFCELMLSRALLEFRRMAGAGVPVFFDRGIPDLIGYARLLGVDASAAEAAALAHRYNDLVFMTPSWPAIYVLDEERRMPFEVARSFGESFRAIYADLGYRVVDLPPASPRARAEFVVSAVVDQPAAREGESSARPGAG
jgi:predicted ATPase